MLQPGIDDYAYVTGLFPSQRVVHGMITLTSYHAPLEGEAGPATMNWWFPPLSPSPFSGDTEETQALVKLLKSGGLPAKYVTDIKTQLRLGSGLLMPLIAALEDAEWKLDQLREPERLALSAKAARQCLDISLPRQVPLLKALLTTPWLLSVILRIAPMVTPFNLEAMLKSHFTKVGLQTRVMLRDYIERASPNQKADAVSALLTRLKG